MFQNKIIKINCILWLSNAFFAILNKNIFCVLLVLESTIQRPLRLWRIKRWWRLKQFLIVKKVKYEIPCLLSLQNCSVLNIQWSTLLHALQEMRVKQIHKSTYRNTLFGIFTFARHPNFVILYFPSHMHACVHTHMRTHTLILQPPRLTCHSWNNRAKTWWNEISRKMSINFSRTGI